MKTYLNKTTIIIFLLSLLIICDKSTSQTFKQYPINGEDKYAIFDIALYENQVAVVGRIRFENKLKVYLFKDNNWIPLPMTVSINGVERYIPYQANSANIRPNIYFDNNGVVWLIGVDGLYSFENNQWISHTLKNVRDDLTRYLHCVFDKQGNIWLLAKVYISAENETKSGIQLYKYTNGEFLQYIEQYSFAPEDFPIINVSALDASKDVKNTGALTDGVILFGDKRFLYAGEDGIQTEIAYVKSDGSAKFLEIPIIDKPIYSGSLKKLNRIFVDSKERVFFLMRYQEGYNQNTGVLTQCCSGIARLDNGKDWYTYTQENNTPSSQNFNDQHIRYATPIDMCELKNNEYLFVMQNNGAGESKNLQLYKLNNDNKFDTLQWKSFLEFATIFRSDYTLISETNLKFEINKLMNEDQIPSILNISGMKNDIYGNVWMFGESFLIRMSDDPTTSVVESIKKPTVIYPNPGNKSIRLSNSVESIVQIDVVSLLGENFLSVHKDFESINVSSLPIGFYMVKIKRMDGSVEYVKYNKN